ncbi:MAG: ABC transporter permease [Thermodesulfobacteriota bacterium]
MTNISYAFRELTTRKGRSCAAIIGMAVGIALYVAFATLSDGYRRLIQLPFAQLSVDVTIQKPSSVQATNSSKGIRLPFSNQPISGSELENIAKVPAIQALMPSVLLWDQSPKGFVIIQGIDPTTPDFGPAKVQEWVVKGRKLNGKSHEVLLEKHFAKFHGKNPGDSILLGTRDFGIVGLVEQKEGSTISAANAYVTINDARALAELQPDTSNMLFAKLRRGANVDVVREQAAQALPGAIVSSTDNIGDMMKGFSAISGMFSWSMGMLALVFAGTVTYRILAGTVSERAAEIGIMKAVGWKQGDVTIALLTETIALGLIGGLAGIFLGYLGSLLLGSMKVSVTMPWHLSPVAAGAGHTAALNVHSVHLPVALSIETVAVALAAAVLVSGLTGSLVARKLAAVKVMEALRSL